MRFSVRHEPFQQTYSSGIKDWMEGMALVYPHLLQLFNPWFVQ